MPQPILKPGDLAPNFKRSDINGKSVSLRDYASSYVFISFLRYAGCPWCNLAIHRLAVEQELLHGNKCEVVAFIQSSESDIESGIINRHQVTPQFPIIADPSMVIYQKYFVRTSVSAGLHYEITNIPSWVQSVYKEGYKQRSINGRFFLAPAAMLISPGDQKIIRADYNADFYDHQSFTNIYDSIAHYNIHGL